MNKPPRLLAVVALLAVAVACGVNLQHPVVAQQPGEAFAVEPTKWEYRIVVIHNNGEEEGQKELNKLGKEGYELAFVTSGQITREHGGPRGGGGDLAPVPRHTLKRAKK